MDFISADFPVTARLCLRIDVFVKIIIISCKIFIKQETII